MNAKKVNIFWPDNFTQIAHANITLTCKVLKLLCLWTAVGFTFFCWWAHSTLGVLLIHIIFPPQPIAYISKSDTPTEVDSLVFPRGLGKWEAPWRRASSRHGVASTCPYFHLVIVPWHSLYLSLLPPCHVPLIGATCTCRGLKLVMSPRSDQRSFSIWFN